MGMGMGMLMAIITRVVQPPDLHTSVKLDRSTLDRSMSGTGGSDALYSVRRDLSYTSAGIPNVAINVWDPCGGVQPGKHAHGDESDEGAPPWTDILCTAPAAIVRPSRPPSRPVPSGLQHAIRQAVWALTAQVVSWLWADGLPAQLAVGSIIYGVQCYCVRIPRYHLPSTTPGQPALGATASPMPTVTGFCLSAHQHTSTPAHQAAGLGEP
ncbi:hypothetical protein DHEL01_v207401 [Diaporthe helianthi]|uniref:Uncharacterized protein n=1 Tax=Diaporthe helianthi TaxID=158607 RepID=A0A2P5HVC2_DIAHE|nr:hypothetical protein DHEL01_v207401 [Diaporthe helianthi]